MQILEKCCGSLIKNLSAIEKQKRLLIIGMFVDLMVYDLSNEQDGVF
jgi:hypothetical protein